MPPNKPAFRLSAAVIESAHDEGIAFTWPGIEPVQSGTCRDLNLLLSAEYHPYQECFGIELYPSLEAKAAYLFYHLTTSHIFGNGNKRTAVLCLDLFLMVNATYLTLDSEEMYSLAKRVASSGEDGISFPLICHDIEITLRLNTLPFRAFRTLDNSMYRELHRRKNEMRQWRINQRDFPLRQRPR